MQAGVSTLSVLQLSFGKITLLIVCEVFWGFHLESTPRKLPIIGKNNKKH